MERILILDPAFDKTNPDPNKNYGIGSVTLRMILKGELGAVQFVVLTARFLEKNQQRNVNRLVMNRRMKDLPDIPDHINNALRNYEGEFTKGKEIEELRAYQKLLSSVDKERDLDFLLLRPMAADIGYHSPKPMYEGQLRMGEQNSDDLAASMRVTSEALKSGKGWDEIPEVKIRMVDEKDLPICEFINAPCYYDGSSLNADPIYRILIEQGEEAVWKELEEYYVNTFEELK